MKIALYISDGLDQIVLTPESGTEKALLEKLHGNGEQEMSIHRGGFYECQGGWIRQRHPSAFDSIMIVLRPVEEQRS